jgi:hypothetical protein
MKKRPMIGVGVIVVVAIVAIVFLIPTSRSGIMGLVQGEHSYQGKTSAEWVQALGDPDEKARRKALMQLNFVSSEWDDPVPVLLDVLKSDNPVARIQAMKALGGLGDRATKAVPALTDALRSPDANVRGEAAHTLAEMAAAAGPAVPALIELLKDKSAGVRQEAVVGITRIGLSPNEEAKDAARTAVPALVEAYQTEGSAAVKKRLGAAVWLLDATTAKANKITKPVEKPARGPSMG